MCGIWNAITWNDLYTCEFFVFQSEREAGVSAVIFVGVYNARNGTGVCYHVSMCDLKYVVPCMMLTL